MESDNDIRDLLAADADAAEEARQSNTRISRVLRRTRAGVGQRDTLMLALVRIWTAIAELLAPVFAQLAVRKVKLETHRPLPPAATPDGNQQTDTNQ